MTDASAQAWLYEKLGTSSKLGVLRLNDGRLSFESDGEVQLDVALTDARVNFPAFALGALMNVKTADRKYKFSFYDPMKRSALAQMQGRKRGGPLRSALRA